MSADNGAQRTADRAIRIAQESSDATTAIARGFADMSEQLGLLAGDVAAAREENARRFAQIEVSLRTVAQGRVPSLTEEALAALAMANAEQKRADAKAKGARWEIMRSAATLAVRMLAPAAIAVGVILAAQVQGCVPDLPRLTEK